VNRNENEDGRASFLRGYYRGTGTCVVQEGRGEYGAHTVKNSYAGRARGTQGRDRSEGSCKRKKVVERKEDKKTKKAGGKKKK